MRTQVLILVMLVLAGTRAPLGEQFALRDNCRLHFRDIAPTRDPFVGCDNAGRTPGAPSPPLHERLRSDAKNNLCAPAEGPILMNFGDFDRLPAPASSRLTTSRASLRKILSLPAGVIGEGVVVQVIAKIAKAAVTNCREVPPGAQPGEAVNCHSLFGVLSSEMSLALVPIDSIASECDSVTAKMIPHFRPKRWEAVDVQTPVPPVRITGQLFYDDAGDGCQDTAEPAADIVVPRRTKWEIHPVYAVDVCIASEVEACSSLNAEAWMPYDEWIQLPDPDVRSTGSLERMLCEEASLKWVATRQKSVPE